MDPFYKISALDIISDVFSNFVLTPLGIFGHHFKVFIHEYYSDSTLVLIIVKTVVACIFCFSLFILVLFFTRGYRLRTLFMTIEPVGIF